MPGGAVRTVHRDGRWLNEVEGQARPIDDVFERKEDAVLAGRDIARDLGVGHRVDPGDGREPVAAAEPVDGRESTDGEPVDGREPSDRRGPETEPGGRGSRPEPV